MINVAIFLMRSQTLTSSRTTTNFQFWNVDPVSLLLFNHIHDLDLMIIQCSQTVTHQNKIDLLPPIDSLRPMNNERKGLRGSFEFFHKKSLPNRQLNNTLPLDGELRDSWEPGALEDVPPFVTNCNCIEV